LAVFLVRHARAGDRQKWKGPNHLRPLSKKGRKQAERLAALLATKGIGRIVSSPFERCIQTVLPLADRLRLEVETDDVLAEGAPAEKTLRLVRDIAPDDPALCTHGDVIATLLDALVREDGLKLPQPYPYAKGSTWVLETDASGRFVAAKYLPPL
jgi:broad specificity phosphatase PhoE